jgi:hypothetical protein
MSSKKSFKALPEKGVGSGDNERFKYLCDQASMFYLQGWCVHLAVENVTADLIADALPFIAIDSESIEVLMQKSALQETLLGRLETSLQHRLILILILNIQLALDIRNSLN